MTEKKKLRVLIAEDDFLVGDEIVRIIKGIGYEHLGTAPNGLRAIEMTKELKPDVILMDIKMPKMNGLEASRIIQSEVPTPIIILTAHESQELVEEASAAGVGAYLTKPPQQEEVERAVTIAFARQTDLMNMRLLNDQLKEREQKLKELNISKDKFFSIIAHDLRSPLGALIGYSNIVVDDFTEMEDDEKIELIKYIQKISTNMNGLLESLLEWSQYETGRMEYQPSCYIISDSIFNVIGLLKPGADRKEITLQLEVDKSLKVYADAQMIETVLRNLISNALKFTPRGGIINIVTMEGKEGHTVKVQDNGVGMTVEQMDKLFVLGNSNSTTGTESENGSGLGLVLCKELIEKNGGEFSVSSTVGVGSEFYFQLPRKETECR